MAYARFLLIECRNVTVFHNNGFQLLRFLGMILRALTLNVNIYRIGRIRPRTISAYRNSRLRLMTRVQRLLLRTNGDFIIRIFLPIRQQQTIVDRRFTQVFHISDLYGTAHRFRLQHKNFAPSRIDV